MTLEHDFDPDLARRLEARLAPYAPVARIAPAPGRRTSRRSIVVAALAAALAASAIGLGYEINASAESQGLGCLHPIAKVRLFAGDHHAVDATANRGHDAGPGHEACHP